MSDDIVTRLREWHTSWDWDLPDQAADEIERLRAALLHCRWHWHPHGECQLCDTYQSVADLDR